MAGKLADGDLVWSFLEFDDLLVDKLGLLVYNKVGI